MRNAEEKRKTRQKRRFRVGSAILSSVVGKIRATEDQEVSLASEEETWGKTTTL